ncbi:unnamed protein product [Anisakis simplex]|uniref:SUN domain-containing protein n=1 Tax=Anisakis simplex TaxID=6269 RepID=A0A0M3IZA1_ANISI|nr:unnamed protein product [Anisakis simplex]
MVKVGSGWIGKARAFLESHRGVPIDDIIERKRQLLNEFLPKPIVRPLWALIVFTVFHLKLLHAITQPLHCIFTKGIKSNVLKNGNLQIPRFSFHKIGTEVAVMLLTLSAFWHYFTIPNPLGLLRWGVTVRPQVNVKPRMSVLRKSHSQRQLIKTSSSFSTHKAAIRRSLSDSQLFTIDTNVEIGIDSRLTNSLVDPILNTIDTVSESVSLASELASSVISGFYTRSSNASDITHLSLANCSNAGSLAGSYAGSIASSYAGSDLDDGWESDDSWEVAQTDKGDSDESLHTAKSVDQLSDRGSICDENKDIGKNLPVINPPNQTEQKQQYQGQLNEPKEKSVTYEEHEILPAMRWFSWKLPVLWRYWNNVDAEPAGSTDSESSLRFWTNHKMNIIRSVEYQC